MKKRCLSIGCIILSLLMPFSSNASLFGEFGLKEEMEMGREIEMTVKTTLPVIEDPEITSYVSSVVNSIVKTLPPQPYAFPSHVVLHDSLNAFAAPGGFIFVFTGLIMNMQHESELAGVLSHEIAHVVQRHIAGRMERGKVVSLASLLGAIAGLAVGMASGNSEGGSVALVGSMAAGASAMLKYSRADEDDADRFGLQYLIKAGYDPKGMQRAFEILKSQEWGGRSSVPSYLSTHPDLDLRISRIRTDLQSRTPKAAVRRDDEKRFHRVQSLIWARYGNPSLAARYFERGNASDSMNVLGRAMLASRQHQVQKAGKLFQDALALSPGDPLVLREAGIFAYESGGDITRAKKLLDEALRLSPRDIYAMFYCARIFDDAGNYAEAQKIYRKLLRSVPKDSELYQHYGNSLGKSGRQCEAYINLSYSALYAANMKKARRYHDMAAKMARTPEDKALLKEYEIKSAEFSGILKKLSK